MTPSLCRLPRSVLACLAVQVLTVLSLQARALQPKADAFVQVRSVLHSSITVTLHCWQAPADGALMASYSVFVVEPGATPVEVSEVCEDCSLGPVWLLYLCIAFGILFLVMLVINLFLCSAMSCRSALIVFICFYSSVIPAVVEDTRTRRLLTWKISTPTPGPGRGLNMALGKSALRTLTL